jgi:hypothetical protein
MAGGSTHGFCLPLARETDPTRDRDGKSENYFYDDVTLRDGDGSGAALARG